MPRKKFFSKIKSNIIPIVCIVCTFLVASISAGCTSAANNINKSVTTKTPLGKVSEAYPTTLKRETPYSQPEKVTDSETPEDVQDMNTARAAKLTSIIRTMKEVESATVVVHDSTALVGIELKEDISDEEITSLKKVIEGKILENDKKIKRAAITTAPELTEKIGDIANDTLEGRPKDIPNISSDLENALKRVSPTI